MVKFSFMGMNARAILFPPLQVTNPIFSATVVGEITNEKYYIPEQFSNSHYMIVP